MKTNTAVSMLFGTIVVLCFFFPVAFGENQYVIGLGISVFLWAAVAESWNLLAGMGGMWSLGHTVFFGVGAYITAYLATGGVPLVVGFAAGSIAAVLLAAVLGCFICRMSGHYFTLVTFVFVVGVGVVVRYFNQYTGGGYGLSVPLYMHPAGWLNLSWQSETPYYYAALTVALVVLVLVWIIKHSAFGYRLAAVREDPRAARAIGIDVFKTKLAAFVCGAALAALPGVVYVCYYRLVSPSSAFSVQATLNPVIYSVAGGVGSVLGPMVGTVVLVPLSSYLQGLSNSLPGINGVVYGLLLMFLTLVMPRGVMGIMRSCRRSIVARLRSDG